MKLIAAVLLSGDPLQLQVVRTVFDLIIVRLIRSLSLRIQQMTSFSSRVDFHARIELAHLDEKLTRLEAPGFPGRSGIRSSSVI
ncbi:hypothetical protein BJ742DRAFT_775233 [Cladochytrium replicatum]|nr:hypothetical protein BJ742DRAFT_775233 [Cladochytrium replicatum]